VPWKTASHFLRIGEYVRYGIFDRGSSGEEAFALLEIIANFEKRPAATERHTAGAAHPEEW
jgi:hypothetical protein